MNLEEKLTSAKIKLLTNQPWFGQLSCYLRFIETKTMPYAAGINERGDLFYNPEILKDWNTKQLMMVVCHEIMHLALRHTFRVGQRNPLIWNFAADLKVNEELQNTNQFEFVPGLLVPSRSGEYTFPGTGVTITEIETKSTEQLYEELMQRLPKKFVTAAQTCQKLEEILKDLPPQAQDALKNYIKDLVAGKGAGDPKDGEGGGKGSADPNQKFSPSELEEFEHEWRTRVNQANQSAAGNIPAGIKRELAKMENSQLPWHYYIRQRFSRVIRQRTWMRPSKKFLPIYTPGTKKVTGINAVFAIDTSGSISDAELRQFVAEIYGLYNAFNSIHLWIAYCDADVHDMFEIKPKQIQEMIKHPPMGGGGTDFIPVFDLIKKKLHDHIDCLIFATDGEPYRWPEKKPKYPVFWVSDRDNVKWPFGKFLKLKI